MKDDFYYLGKILKTHGNKGHLLILLDVESPSTYSKTDAFFLSINNDLVPFIIQEITLKQNKLAEVAFEDVESNEEAKQLVGCELYLPTNMLPPIKGKKFHKQEIIGFQVVDENRGNIGIVAAVLEFPKQLLLEVRFEDKEILIPLVDAILINVDRKKEVVNIRAPEGLIDLYL